MNAATVVGSGLAAALWNETRGSSQTGWVLGELILGFIMAMNATPGTIQDMAFGISTGAAVYLAVGPRSGSTGVRREEASSTGWIRLAAIPDDVMDE